MKRLDFGYYPSEFESQDEQREFYRLLRQGWQQWKNKRFDEALDTFTIMEKRWPNSPQVLGWLGTVHEDLGHLERAIEYLEQTVRVSPLSELASISLFHVLRKAGEAFQDYSYWDRSIAEAERFIHLLGRPSVQYGLILKDLRGELTDDEVRRHMEEYDELLGEGRDDGVP